MRAGAWALTAALVAAFAQPAAGAMQCASRPEVTPPPQIRAVHAESVDIPPSTPPLAVLDTGVGPVGELEARIHRGANLVKQGAATADPDGHGSAVATIAAGRIGPAQGVSPTTPIIPITILGSQGDTTTARLVDGINRAVRLGARVINVSLAGPTAMATPADHRALRRAIFSAVSRRVAVVAPAGNEGSKGLDVPAVYPHVISVGASDETGSLASYSNFGVGMDLLAPGASITTAVPEAVCRSGYAIVSGSSFAAPSVAGAAELLLARQPELDVAQLTDMLRRSQAPGQRPAWSIERGFGILDVARLLADPVPPRADGEVNDDPSWADRHPAVLAAPARRRVVTGRLTPKSDPADVFRVRLKQGDRFAASVSSSGAKLRLSFGTSLRRIGSGEHVRVPRSGIYYVGVAVRRSAPAGTTYALSLAR
ncbi:MAG TPA: S8 family serine peptidase [Thermoleophilaceae bacterium]